MIGRWLLVERGSLSAVASCEGRISTRCRAYIESIFTEGNKGNEEPGVSAYQISRQALLLPLITGIQRRFVVFCSKSGYGFNH
jgi:hypothetical protein